MTTLRIASGAIQGVLDRNPLYTNGRITLARLHQEMAVIDPTLREAAIYQNELAVTLIPVVWQRREPFIRALIVMAQFERALEEVELAKELGASLDGPGDANREASEIFYLEAKALQALGRYEETLPIIEFLQSQGVDPDMRELLIDLLASGE